MLSIARRFLLLLALLSAYVSVTGAKCRDDGQCTGASERCDSDGNGTPDGRCVAGICVSDRTDDDEPGSRQ